MRVLKNILVALMRYGPPVGDEQKSITLRSRYTKFEGEFVIHCHILGHEDMGMMERVKISK